MLEGSSPKCCDWFPPTADQGSRVLGPSFGEDG